MKHFITTIAVLFSVLTMGAQALFVGTYNIRYKNDGDSINGNVWAKRCQVICDQINFEQPDVFGTQEAYNNQLHDMDSRLGGYTHIGIGRDDGKDAGEHSAIFYKTDCFELLSKGDFWLSEHPDRPGLGWDAVCPRICTWGEFRDKATRFRFFFFNLHMDHVGVTARREAAKLVVSKIKEMSDGKAPAILTGDFNVDQNDEIYKIFTKSGVLKDSYTSARLRFAENGTFNDFKTDLKTDSRIDHIFVSPDFDVRNYGVLTNSYWTPSAISEKKRKSRNAPQQIDFQRFERRTPSDHYPVFARIIYNN